MREKHIYFVLLAFTAIFAVLIACGSGDIIDITDQTSEEYKNMRDSRELLITDDVGLMKGCISGLYTDNCPGLNTGHDQPSSNSKEDESSSSAEAPPVEESSSSQGEGNSSQTESSSSNIISSSSSQGISSSSVNGDIHGLVPAFECKWDPPNPYSTQVSEIKIAIGAYDENALECSASNKAVYSTTNMFGTTHSYYFDIDAPYEPVFGENVAGITTTTGAAVLKWPAEPSGNSDATFTVKGTVSCLDKESGNTGSKEENCVLTIRKPPEPIPTGALAWTNGRNNTWTSTPAGTIFFIGETPAYSENVAISNVDAVPFCGEVEYAKSWTSPVAAAGTITVTARCSKTQKVLATATATVVPNPTLSGTCEWNTKGNTFGGGVSAKTTTIPTINNQYGRACAGPYFAVNGEQRESVDDGLVVDAWTGDPQTMADITIGATCEENALTSINCQNITVKNPDAMCEYQASWCNGIAISQVITTAQNNPEGNSMKGRCVFATALTDLRGVEDSGGGTLINGTEMPTQLCGTDWGRPACATWQPLLNIERADDGYYIYIGQNTWTSNGFNTSNSQNGLHPNCQ
jgi:hypothetical protein